MTARAARPPGYEALEALSAHLVGQILGGQLHVHPRPSSRHAVATSAIGEELGPPFRRGRGGPGGWVILDEPELHLGGDVIVPDLAGWRRERLADTADDAAHFTVAPDWVCEVESPSTRRVDRGIKRELYRREQVRWLWAVDPDARLLEVFELRAGVWALTQTATDEPLVRAVPFDAIELELPALWER